MSNADGDLALGGLVSQLNFAAIGAAQGQLLIHAGAVSTPDGATAVLCGPSGSGKTTLTARLLRHGLSYVTDETVCLDPVTLRITPYRKPLSLKRGSETALPDLTELLGCADAPFSGGSWLVPPSALERQRPSPAPLSPTLLVFPTFSPGVGCEVEELAPSTAAFLLGESSSRLAHVDGGGLRALARLARRAPAYRLVHGDVDAAAAAVRDLWAAA